MDNKPGINNDVFKLRVTRKILLKKKTLRGYNGIKCITCGRFISYTEMDEGGGASYHYDPPSYYTSEDGLNEWQCKKCTDKHGVLT